MSERAGAGQRNLFFNQTLYVPCGFCRWVRNEAGDRWKDGGIRAALYSILHVGGNLERESSRRVEAKKVNAEQDR